MTVSIWPQYVHTEESRFSKIFFKFASILASEGNRTSNSDFKNSIIKLELRPLSTLAGYKSISNLQ